MESPSTIEPEPDSLSGQPKPLLDGEADTASVEGRPALAIDLSLYFLLRSTSEIITRAEEVDNLVSKMIAERDEIRREVAKIKREQDALLQHVRELKAAAEMDAKAAREEAQREAEAIIAEAETTRARAVEEARALEARVQDAEKRARAILSELLATTDVVRDVVKAEASSGLDRMAPAPSAPSEPQCTAEVEPVSPADQIEYAPQPAEEPQPMAEVECPAEEVVEPEHEAAIEPAPSAVDAEPAPEAVASDDQATEPIEATLSDEPSVAVPVVETAVSEVENKTPAEPQPMTATEQTEPALTAEPEPVSATVTTAPSGPISYQLFVHPIRSFGSMQELERRLGEIGSIESLKIVDWQSPMATIQATTRAPKERLLDELVKQIPNGRIVRAEEQDLELELAHRTGV